MFQIGWSGRVDPDGNISNFVTPAGRRTTTATATPLWTRCSEDPGHDDMTTRRDLFGQVITQLHKDPPIIYLYRLKNFTGVARPSWACRCTATG